MVKLPKRDEQWEFGSLMRVSAKFDNCPPYNLNATFVVRGTNSGQLVPCPYGARGDRLWVRETWRESHGGGGQIHYAASVSEYERNEKGPWKPSIHMPRAASRLVLEVKAVRVERLQEISEDDAEAEGIEKNWCGPLDKGPNGFGSEGWMAECGWIDYLEDEEGFPAATPIDSYRSLWDSINAKRGHGWASNPWIWVVEFERVQP